MASSAARQGFQFGGSGADIVRGAQFAANSASAQGGQYTATHVKRPGVRGIRPRGVAYAGGTTPGARYAPSAGAWGGQYDGPADASVADLIETDGFALVLEAPSGSDRLAFSPEQPAYQDIKEVSWTTEVNKMASWQARVPMNPEVYGWNFARAVIAYDGERRFHGVLLSIETGELRDGELSLSGYGPLFWAGHGDITVHYSNIAAWRALEDLWLKVAKATEGRVRGEVVRPRPEHVQNHIIPESGVEWSGTPAEVIQQAHGYAGMAFSFDHSESAAVAQSFVPGEELRDVAWQPKSVKPAISTEGYHNQVTVIGAKKRPAAEPITSDDRFSATVSAPEQEINAILGGRIHGRTEREYELESFDACLARASTLLAEDRGEFTVGGSLGVTPSARRVVPGYTYRIEPFDEYVPSMFSPVWCSLRSISQTYSQNEASISLSFDDESRLVEHIRADLVPEGAPRSIDRRDEQLQQANPNSDEPMNLTYAAGDGLAGSSHAGAAWEGHDGR